MDISEALRKPELIDVAVGTDDDELSECIELINERDTAKGEDAEAERQIVMRGQEIHLGREKLQRAEKKRGQDIQDE